MSSSQNDRSTLSDGIDLNTVRAEIDKLDQVILNAIEDRANLAAQVAKAKNGHHTFRPGREADLIRNLTRQSHLPSPLLEQIWRAIIAHNLTSQAGLRIAMVDDAGISDAAQYRFGGNVIFQTHAAADDVVAAVAGGAAQLGIVPDWSSDNSWIAGLARRRVDGEAVYISAFTHMLDTLKSPPAVILSSVLPDPSSADMTVTITDGQLHQAAGYHSDASGLLGIYQICDIS